MGDFSQKYITYNVNLPFHLRTNDKLNSELSFIKIGILSIFEGNAFSITSCKDGIIDEKEFNTVSQKEYEKQVKEMEAYYKQSTGKELQYHIPSYKELQQMLNNENKNDFTMFSNLKKMITPKEIEEPIKPNSTIGYSAQEGSGECYLNASNMALSFSDKGAVLLKKSISESPMGGYYVTLYGAKDRKGNPIKYFISQKELKQAQEEYINMTSIQADGSKKTARYKRYSSGDADIVLLDLAIEKYRKASKYKLRYQDTKAVKGYDDYLSGGFSARTLELITGKKGYRDTYQYVENVKNNNLTSTANAKPVKGKSYKAYADRDKKLDLRLKNIAENQNLVISTCTFLCADNNWGNFKKYNLYENHAYAIKSVNLKGGYAEISNPHNGNGHIIKIPLTEFKKYVAGIDFIYTT
ncbi:hypothetical protein HDR58_01320 [bacterium]|nr:hypothetical protein [bacterium]